MNLSAYQSGGAGAGRNAARALSQTKGGHPTTRMDAFLRHTDEGYMHGESQTHGDRFVRKMATYGHVRPSVSFTNEPRITRPINMECTVGKSNLPPTWHDPKGDPREGTFAPPPPPTEINNDYVECLENRSLMMPSERYKEHIYMKEAEKKWRQDRKDHFLYKKRMRIIERQHPGGIVGVDGPMMPDTQLYADQRSYYEANIDRRAVHAEARHDQLSSKALADDATAMRNFGEPTGLGRSKDLGIQTRRVDPGTHPFRFLNTHDRLFPSYVPTWDPERAAALRSHDVRDKQHHAICGGDNAITYKVSGEDASGPSHHPAQMTSNANWSQTRHHPRGAPFAMDD